MKYSLRIPNTVLPFLFFLFGCALLPRAQTNIQLSQIYFADSIGNVVVPNSMFGYLELDLPIDPVQTFYLQVVMEDIQQQPVWIVQNYPIFPSSMTRMDPRRGLDFDISLLGLQPGQTLPEVNMGFIIDTFQTQFPLVPPPQSFVVDSFIRIASGGAKLGAPFAPLLGTIPFGCLFPMLPTEVILHDSTGSVQEECKACLAGALARSIDWLNRRDTLGSNKTAQEWYQCLRDKKVGSSGAGASTYEEDIATKDSIFKALDTRGRTKLLDKCNAIDTVANVPQDTAKDVVEFICEELPSRDVELHYDNHIITVTGKFKIGTDVYLFYRDDEKQADSTKGDTAEKVACLKKDSTGHWLFRGQNGGGFWKIKVVISEYIDSTANFISEGLLAGTELRAFPNPGNGHFQIAIESPRAQEVAITVTDLHGRQLLSSQQQLFHGTNPSELDLSAYPSGIYLFHIQHVKGGQRATLRLLRL